MHQCKEQAFCIALTVCALLLLSKVILTLVGIRIKKYFIGGSPEGAYKCVLEEKEHCKVSAAPVKESTAPQVFLALVKIAEDKVGCKRHPFAVYIHPVQT